MALFCFFAARAGGSRLPERSAPPPSRRSRVRRCLYSISAGRSIGAIGWSPSQFALNATAVYFLARVFLFICHARARAFVRVGGLQALYPVGRRRYSGHYHFVRAAQLSRCAPSPTSRTHVPGCPDGGSGWLAERPSPLRFVERGHFAAFCAYLCAGRTFGAFYFFPLRGGGRHYIPHVAVFVPRGGQWVPIASLTYPLGGVAAAVAQLAMKGALAPSPSVVFVVFLDLGPARLTPPRERLS